MKSVLSIAGSDCSGGAGIQADIKTITAHKLYAMSVITALTAQNTTGVYGIQNVTADFVALQLDCIFTDIVPDAVKIGMISSIAILDVIAEKLQQYGAKNIVLDPVMVSTSGHRLMDEATQGQLMQSVFPLARVLTPNIPEAELLTGQAIETEYDMETAARHLAERMGCAVLVKGGHLVCEAKDVLCENDTLTWFVGERVDTKNTHGTGCTLSSAIACQLALGKTLPQSIHYAKQYLTGALRFGLNLGQGNGPLHHTYAL